MIDLSAAATGGSSSTDLLGRLSIIVQIAFFSITAAVAVLSYISAKRTLFQPLRTEIFKKQINGLSAILELLAGKGELDLREDFHFNTLVEANIAEMYDAYLAYAFKMKRPEDQLEYRSELCPVIAVRPEHLERYAPYRVDDAPATATEEPQTWEYRNHAIAQPKGYLDKIAEFRTILDSPLLPRSIAELVEKYLATVEDNAMAIGDVVIECASRMPEYYPTLEDLTNASYGWIHDEWIQRFTKLEPLAKQINDAVRAYFDTDNLLPQRAKVKPRWSWPLLHRVRHNGYLHSRGNYHATVAVADSENTNHDQ